MVNINKLSENTPVSQRLLIPLEKENSSSKNVKIKSSKKSINLSQD